MVDPDNRAAEKRLTGDVIHRLAQGENVVVKAQEDRIEAVTLLDPAAKIYLYASRDSDVPAFSQMERARAVLADYDDFTARSRALQLQFNAALFLGSLLLVGLTRSEEHTSELQSLMRTSYAVFCLKKKISE